MAHDLVRKQYKVFDFNSLNGTDGWGDQDFNGTADLAVFTAVCPVEIYKFGYVTTSSQDPDAGGFQLDLDRRPLTGSDSGRVLVDSIVRVDANVIAQGKVVYKEVIVPVAQAAGDDTLTGGVTSQTSVVNVGPSGPLRLAPGEQAVLEVSNAVGAASTGFLFIEYAELGFEKAHANVILDA